MAENSGIEWTHDTANPWWGCTKVSRACKNCYAAEWSSRHISRMSKGELDTVWGKNADRWHRFEAFEKDLRRSARRSAKEGRPRRVFIASMADVFEDREDLVEPRKRLWDLLFELEGQITPLLLTKRPQVAFEWVRQHGWPPGAWLGITVEDQATLEERIAVALNVGVGQSVDIPLFLSCEPLAGALDLTDIKLAIAGGRLNALTGMFRLNNGPELGWGGGKEPLSKVRWVIAGGESGRGAQPSHPAWFAKLADDCTVFNVPFFFKQWGAWRECEDGERLAKNETFATITGDADIQTHLWDGRPRTLPEGAVMRRVGKKVAGSLMDGLRYAELPREWQR